MMCDQLRTIQLNTRSTYYSNWQKREAMDPRLGYPTVSTGDDYDTKVNNLVRPNRCLVIPGMASECTISAHAFSLTRDWLPNMKNNIIQFRFCEKLLKMANDNKNFLAAIIAGEVVERNPQSSQ